MGRQRIESIGGGWGGVGKKRNIKAIKESTGSRDFIVERSCIQKGNILFKSKTTPPPPPPQNMASKRKTNMNARNGGKGILLSEWINLVCLICFVRSKNGSKIFIKMNCVKNIHQNLIKCVNYQEL